MGNGWTLCHPVGYHSTPAIPNSPFPAPQLTDLFLVLVLVADAVAIWDIMRRLRATTPRILWIVCVLAVPLIGAAYWVHVQYSAPEARRLRRRR